MKKSKGSELRTKRDIDVQIVVRSGRLKVREVNQLCQLIADQLSSDPLALIVTDEDTLLQRNSDRTLITVTLKLQSED